MLKSSLLITLVRFFFLRIPVFFIFIIKKVLDLVEEEWA